MRVVFYKASKQTTSFQKTVALFLLSRIMANKLFWFLYLVLGSGWGARIND